MKITAHILAALVAFSPALHAEKKTASARSGVFTPEQQLAGFTVPDGFVVELVASEQDGVVNPIDLTFDDAGRLWTQTARMYPLDPVKDIKWNELLKLMDDPEKQDAHPEFKRIKDLYQGKTQGSDDILILSNLGKGQSLTVEKFATGLTIPQSILPYKNGVFVAQGSELFFLDDTDNNGKADERTPVLTGFGFTDTHTMAHSLVRAPGGWIHFSQGALNKGNIRAVRSGESTRIDYSKIARFSIDGNHLGLVSSGLNNIWGFQLRGNGQWYLTEANDFGHSVNPAEPSTGFTGIGNEKLRPYQPMIPVLHQFRVGGTGISGLAFSDDTAGGFPREWQDVAFLANPITSTINAVRIVRNSDGTVTAEHLPDFLQSEDDWFRPVNIEFGPDGCLYIADWYNKIVSHNEVPTTHPDRDKSHGRIWRVRPKSLEERTIPNLYKAPTTSLLDHLQSPILWEKRAAWHQIADRNIEETRMLIPSLIALAGNLEVDKITRIHALWSLESIGHFDQSLLEALIKDEDGDLRREAIRTLAAFEITPDLLAKLLVGITTEKNVMVRSQALRTLEDLGKASNATIDLAVSFCHPASADNHLGGGYEINFERYLARRALERYPAELRAYLQSPLAENHAAENLIWAQQALGGQTPDAFEKQWQTLKKKALDKDTLVILSGICGDAEIQKMVTPYFSDTGTARHIAEVALEHIADAYSPAIGYPLAETVMALVRTENSDDVILGLELARAYRITHLCPEFAKRLPAAKDENTRREIIRTLSHSPKPFANELLSVVNDTSHSTSLRITALSAFVQARERSAMAEVVKFLTDNPLSKPSVIEALGATSPGNALLIELIDSKVIAIQDIELPVARRIIHLHGDRPTAKLIHEHAAQKQNNLLAADMARIPELEKMAQSDSGDATVGKALFTGMCLSCHVVGDQGAGVGPALDGSAQREITNLLISIIDPNAASESAYILFRTIESSGLITEGLKSRQDERGTSISHQNGTVSYIPHRTISEQHHVDSTSFMTMGNLSNIPDKALLDLLAYIRTLE